MPATENPRVNEAVLESPEWFELPEEVFNTVIDGNGNEVTLEAKHFLARYPEYCETFVVTPSGYVFCFDFNGKPFIRWATAGCETELTNAGFTQADGSNGSVPYDVWKLHTLPLSVAHHPEIAQRFNESMRVARP